MVRNFIEEFEEILLRYDILDKNDFMGFRENIKNFVLGLNEIELSCEYTKNGFFHDLSELQKDIDYETDIFNEYIMGKNQNNKNLGQHFTPKCLNKLMSECIEPKMIDGLNVFYEPSGGTGSTMFSAIKKFQRENNFCDWNNHLVIHQDLDLINCTLATLNYALRGINSIVICGDTLHNKVVYAFQTINYNYGFGFSNISVFNTKEELERVKKMFLTNYEKDNE